MNGGGGTGGIALGARLRRLAVPTIILEKNARPGDSWRNRCKSLALHDLIWCDPLPCITFPRNGPVFTPKGKLGDWLEMHARVMELNYRTHTTARSATFHEVTGEWTVVADRDGEALVLKPKQLVMTRGMSGKKRMPSFCGMYWFKGVQQRSSGDEGPDRWAGKKVVVVGSNNSAHNICATLWEHDADVTMIQQSSTHIMRSDILMEIGVGALYSEEAVRNGATSEKADLIFASRPYRILHEFQIPACEAMKERDKEFYEGLEKAGFGLDWGDDGSGLFMKCLRRGSGCYIDVGASQPIIDGEINLKRGQVRELDETGVILSKAAPIWMPT